MFVIENAIAAYKQSYIGSTAACADVLQTIFNNISTKKR